jgi:hypothetical protein
VLIALTCCCLHCLYLFLSFRLEPDCLSICLSLSRNFWLSFACLHTLCLLYLAAVPCLMPSHCLPHAQCLNTCTFFVQCLSDALPMSLRQFYWLSTVCLLFFHCSFPSFYCLITACSLFVHCFSTGGSTAFQLRVHCLSTIRTRNCFSTVCLMLDHLLPTACLQPLYFLSTACPLFTHCLPTVYLKNCYFLSTACPLLAHCLSKALLLPLHCLPTACPLPI